MSKITFLSFSLITLGAFILILGAIFVQDTTAAPGDNVEEDLVLLDQWTTVDTRAFITWFGTKLDPDQKIVDGARGSVGGAVLKDLPLNDPYCAFPMAPNLPMDLYPLCERI